MTLPRPVGHLRPSGGGGGLDALNPLASQALSLPQAAGAALTVDLSVGRDHDSADVQLASLSRLAGTAVGDELAVGLGEGDSVSDVLTGEVTSTAIGPAAVALSVVAATRRLAATRVDQSFTDLTVGAIVTDLLASAAVPAGSVEATTTYPVYHVDSRRSVWDHLHQLAERTGSQITTEPDGSVSFVPAPGTDAAGPGGALGAAAGAVGGALGAGDGADLRAGANVLAWRVGDRAVSPPVTVAALGAASVAGPDRWGVPRGEPAAQTGTARVDPALRDQAGADAATAAGAAAASRATRGGTLRVVGDAGLRPGGVVPWDGQQWRVLRVRHRLSTAGFITDLVVQGAT